MNQYPHLSERALTVDVENLSETELQAKASETLRDDFRESEARQLLRYKEAAERGTALDRLDLILAAAQQGQIEVLFVPYDELDRRCGGVGRRVRWSGEARMQDCKNQEPRAWSLEPGAWSPDGRT